MCELLQAPCASMLASWRPSARRRADREPQLGQRHWVARCGCGLMHLDDGAFDELVPAEVVRELLHALCASMLAFLAAICPAPR